MTYLANPRVGTIKHAWTQACLVVSILAGAMTMLDLNLDCMFADDVWAFYLKAQADLTGTARELFPHTPRAYVKTTGLLCAYAGNKHSAMKYRLEGDIREAIGYEASCERIYQQLPKYARW